MKKILLILTTALSFLFFLLAPAQALSASRTGLLLWFEQLLPTLLPFTILSYLVLHSGMLAACSDRPDSRAVGARELYVIVCGFLFGFPVGSKLACDLLESRQLSREKAAVLFVFSNNLSPVFASSVFHNQLGRPMQTFDYALLYGLPLACCLFLLFSGGRRAGVRATENTASTFSLNMQIVDAGIINGFETLIRICGYIMMFSLFARLTAMLPLAPEVRTFLIGTVEVTNGMSALGSLCDSDVKYLLAMFFLSFGGISGLFQTASIAARTDLSMRRYLLLRLLLAAAAVLIAGLLLSVGIR